MDSHFLVNLVLFFSLFLAGISFLTPLTRRYTFPYTIALLLVGLISQTIVHEFHIPVHISLPPDIIYLVLLPILLFEGALHINFHQFRIQFKTIAFTATFGLLVSIFVIGYGLATLINMPLGVALLFGAIISSTDPIAVLALFKHLGGPKRLALLADGESMFNDATGVVMFRLISAFVVSGAVFSTQAVMNGLGSFIYIFVGSIILGILLGYVVSMIIEHIDNDELVESVMTVCLAIGSFIVAEHFFHFSGVITTVMAGITFGHFGRTRLSQSGHHFIEQLWGFLGYVSVSLVFFFAAYDINLELFTRNLYAIAAAVLMVLVGRAVSVYLSVFLANKLPAFADEPNVPLTWQHILNWGGLRGVIPLVLVYTLPESFKYREEMLAFTLGSLLFTLIINGLTIKTLLIKLKLNIPEKTETIRMLTDKIMMLDKKMRQIQEVRESKEYASHVQPIEKKLKIEQQKVRKTLESVSNEGDLLKSLQLQAIHIERETLHQLHRTTEISENVYFDYETELDLQEDSIEFPEIKKGKILMKDLKTHERLSYRYRLRRIRAKMADFSIFKMFLKQSEEQIITERFSLLQARIHSDLAVLEYLDRAQEIFSSFKNKTYLDLILKVRKGYRGYVANNKKMLATMTSSHRGVLNRYLKEKLAKKLINNDVQMHI